MTPLEVLATVLIFCICAQAFSLLVLRQSLRTLRRRVAKLHGRFDLEVKTLNDVLNRLARGPTKEDMEALRANLIDRKGSEVLVGRINEISKDMMALKVEVGNISRHANAISLKKMIAGVVPRPTEDPPKESA